MKNLKILIVAVMALTLSGCAKTTSVRTSTDFNNVLTASKSSMLLPPIVESKTIDAGGKITINEEHEYQIEQIVVDMLLEKLRAKGYKVQSLSKRNIHDMKISRNILSLQEEYIAKINSIYTPFLQEEKTAFNTALLLENKLNIRKFINADIIVFAEYYLKQQSSGAIFRDSVFSAIGSYYGMQKTADPVDDAAESGSLRIALIDSSNNKLIWSNIARCGYGLLDSAFAKKSWLKLETQRLKSLLDELLSPLPSL